MFEQVPSGIAGIGIDTSQVNRIANTYKKFGEKFVKRILGPEEIQIFHRRNNRDPRRGVLFLATRFAAKEAFSKAIGLGMRSPMAWSRMQTVNAPSGKPMVKLSEPLLSWYEQRFGTAHISVTDETNMVMAFVIVENKPNNQNKS